MNEIKSNIDINNNNLLKNNLEKLKDLSKNSSAKSQLSPKDKAGFEQAARGFEAMFINMMMKEMKSAMLDSESESDLNFGSDTLMGYSDMLFSDEISNSGTGIGIAKMIYEQLTGDELRFKTSTKSFSPLRGRKEEGVPSVDSLHPHSNFPPQGGKDERLIHSDRNDTIKAFSPLRGRKEEGVSSGKLNHQPVFTSGEVRNQPGGNFLDNVISRLDKFDTEISGSAKRNNIPESLIKAVITTESAGKENAMSTAGAKGLMQLMDGTAKDLGVKNSFDPAQNIYGGSKYLKMMLDKYDNDPDMALAAYNAGPGNVDKYGGIPPFNETKQYIKRVKKYLNDFNQLNQAGKEL